MVMSNKDVLTTHFREHMPEFIGDLVTKHLSARASISQHVPIQVLFLDMDKCIFGPTFDPRSCVSRCQDAIPYEANLFGSWGKKTGNKRL